MQNLSFFIDYLDKVLLYDNIYVNIYMNLNINEREIVKMKRFIALSIIAAFLFFNAGEAFCALTNPDLPDRDGISLWDNRIILHSAYQQKEELDSNVFLSTSDRKVDLLSHVNPSLGVEVPFGEESSVSADYDLDWVFFSEHRDQDYLNQRVRGLIEWQLADYKITVDDVFKHYSDRSGSEITARIKRAGNAFRIGASAEFNRLIFDVGYSNIIDAYRTKDLLLGSLTYMDKNNMTNMFDMSVSYRFLPKTSVIIENDVGWVTYYNSSIPPDSWFIQPLIGLRGDLRPGIFSIDLMGGFRYQHYDNSDVFAHKAYVGPVIKGGMNYYWTEDDLFKLTLERSIYESLYQNINYYNVNYAGLKYTHRFNDKIKASLLGSYQLNLYPSETTDNGKTAKRHDNIIVFGCSLRYDMRKWISFEAAYTYSQKISNFSNQDYYDNLLTINGTVGF